MRAHSAAPRGGTRGSSYIDGSSASLAQLGLSETIVSRLAAENIFTISDWERLGRKRFRIFGITTSTAKKIDALTKEYEP